MKARNSLRFQNISTPRQVGETARLKTIRGPDQGSLFVVFGMKASIGRGMECDIQITDPKTSRKHAEIYWSPESKWNIKDLTSSNGVLVNDTARSQVGIRNGDFISMGETTFEFAESLAENTKMLMAPPLTPQQHENKIQARDREIRRVRRLAQFGGGMPEAARLPAQQSSDKKVSPITLIVLAAGAYFLLFVDGDQKKNPPKKTAVTQAQEKKENPEDAARNLATYLPKEPLQLGQLGGIPIEGPKAADMFYRSGFREFTKGNYLRAKKQFETALQIDPEYSAARSYLLKTEKSIDVEIEDHLLKGKQSFDSGQIRESKSHFESVLRLLHYDSSNPKYLEAEGQLIKIRKSLKGETG